jgi:DNA-binding XRE family transcriptional regulator
VIDFYCQLRQKMIDVMQMSLKQIRQVLGFGVQEFGDLIGLTRQTITNIETQRNKMSSIQYIAVCAVIDNCVKDKPELLPVISTILCSNEGDCTIKIFETIENGSLLKKWFMCFSDESKVFGFLSDTASILVTEDFNNIAKNYRVFLDQTVLFKDDFSNVIQPLAIALKNSGNKFIIPLKVIEAIQYQLMSSNEGDVYLAKNGMKLLMSMQNEKLIDIRGEKSDVNIISTFVSVFAKFKCVNRLALITCDVNLAKQILALNNDVLGGFNILVLKYSKDNGLKKWEQEDLFDEKIEQPILMNDNTELKNKDSIAVLKGWETID